MAGSPRGAAATNRVLYATGFETSEGFDESLTLIGQSGWVGYGSGGNGLVKDFFAGEGQHGFLGYSAPTNRGEFLNVWRPLNYVPGPTNPPVVRFSVLMSVEDSVSSTNRDDFRWSVYNVQGDRLFSVDFDNVDLGINYLLDDDRFVATGFSFTNAQTYQLELVMDLASNVWSATLDGAALVTAKPITTKGATVDLGDVDAVWAVRVPGKAGDNFLVFDRYQLVVEGASPRPPPRLQAVGVVQPGGQFLVRVFGTPGVSYLLQGGADLGVWTPLRTNTVLAEGYFDHLDGAGPARRFFRASER